MSSTAPRASGLGLAPKKFADIRVAIAGKRIEDARQLPDTKQLKATIMSLTMGIRAYGKSLA